MNENIYPQITQIAQIYDSLSSFSPLRLCISALIYFQRIRHRLSSTTMNENASQMKVLLIFICDYLICESIYEGVHTVIPAALTTMNENTAQMETSLILSVITLSVKLFTKKMIVKESCKRWVDWVIGHKICGMKTQFLLATLILLLMFVGCQAPTAEPTSQAITSIPTETAISLTATPPEPSPTAVPSPTPRVTPSYDVQPEAITYNNALGNYSITVPPQSQIYEETNASLDGFFAPAKQITSIVNQPAHFALTIEYWLPIPNPATVQEVISAQASCVHITPEAGEALTINGYEARLYTDVACGARPNTFLYLLADGIGYIFRVDSDQPYAMFGEAFLETVNSFTAQPPMEKLPAPLYFLHLGNQLFRLERDAITTRQMSDEPYSVSSFAVSPNGRIAYITTHVDDIDVAGAEIFIIDEDGTNRQQINEQPLNLFGSSPQLAWSADGQLLAYDTPEGILVLNMTSNETQLLLPNPPAQDGTVSRYHLLSWSPNGRYLLLHETMIAANLGPQQNPTAKVFDLETESLITLDKFCCQPVWSADSQYIFMVGSNYPHGAPGLFQIDVATGAQATLIGGDSLTEDEPIPLPSNPFIVDQQLYFVWGEGDQTTAIFTELAMADLRDDPFTFTSLDAGQYAQIHSAVWHHNPLGALLNISQAEPPYRPIWLWVPVDGEAVVRLPLDDLSRDPQWGFNE